MHLALYTTVAGLLQATVEKSLGQYLLVFLLVLSVQVSSYAAIALLVIEDTSFCEKTAQPAVALMPSLAS